VEDKDNINYTKLSEANVFLHTEKVKEMRVIHKNHIVMYRGKLCSRDIQYGTKKMRLNVFFEFLDKYRLFRDNQHVYSRHNSRQI